jgi:hypothetical protein
LGWCYHNGIGVSVDKEKAFSWYQKAAEAGNTYAQRDLGLCYETGIGVSVDNEKAFFWYQKAAEAGNTDAQWNLSCYGEEFFDIKKRLKLEIRLHNAIWGFVINMVLVFLSIRTRYFFGIKKRLKMRMRNPNRVYILVQNKTNDNNLKNGKTPSICRTRPDNYDFSTSFRE